MSQLKERSALLEVRGRSAEGEAEAVRQQLAAAREELEEARASSGALEERLGTLEQECRDAQTAQEGLRCGAVLCFEYWWEEGGGRVWPTPALFMFSLLFFVGGTDCCHKTKLAAEGEGEGCNGCVRQSGSLP